jgi:choline dehydrogenase
LSGIGPKDYLRELKIPGIQDAKVGYNLQDHVTLGNWFFTVNQPVCLPPDDPVSNTVGCTEFLVKHNGTFTVPAATEAIAFQDLKGSGDVNKIELLFASSSREDVDAALKTHGARGDILSETYLALRSKNAYSVPLYFSNLTVVAELC